jgi:hypothetical protein
MEKVARKVPKDQRPSFGKSMRVFGMGHGRPLATMSASTSNGSGLNFTNDAMCHKETSLQCNIRRLLFRLFDMASTGPSSAESCAIAGLAGAPSVADAMEVRRELT